MMQTLRAFFDRLVSLINANSLTGALILMVGFIALGSGPIDLNVAA